MNALDFSGTIEANFHIYRIHGDGGDETMEVEPVFTDAADGRALFHSPGGRDFVIACGFLDQVVDLTLSYSQDPPATSLEQDRLGATLADRALRLPTHRRSHLGPARRGLIWAR